MSQGSSQKIEVRSDSCARPAQGGGKGGGSPMLKSAFKLGGDLGNFNLIEIAQLVVGSGKTGMLSVNDGVSEYLLYYTGGRIVHAMTDDDEGENVAIELFGVTRGRFSFHSGLEAPTQTVFMELGTLLFEAIRRMDEAREAGESESFARGAQEESGERPKLFLQEGSGPTVQVDLSDLIEDFAAPDEPEVQQGADLNVIDFGTRAAGAELARERREQLESRLQSNFEISRYVIHGDEELQEAVSGGIAALRQVFDGAAALEGLLHKGELECVVLCSDDGGRELLFSAEGFAVEAELKSGCKPVDVMHDVVVSVHESIY